MALGASPRQVLWIIARESLILSIAGVVLGLPLAIVGARFCVPFFLVLLRKIIGLVLAVLGTCAVVVVASVIPARRAIASIRWLLCEYE